MASVELKRELLVTWHELRLFEDKLLFKARIMTNEEVEEAYNTLAPLMDKLNELHDRIETVEDTGIDPGDEEAEAAT